MAVKILKDLAESTSILRRNLGAATRSSARRRARSGFLPLVAGLEDRQLLTGYRFISLTSFTPGAVSTGGLVADSRGDLFGTTYNGGKSGQGSVFEIPKGSHRVRTLASFTDATGWHPLNAIAIDARGNLYGATVFGGPNGVGSIFELRKGSRSVTPLASFARDASGAEVITTNLVADNQGNLFGTASPYGESGGTVFELASGSHTLTTLTNLDRPADGNGLTVDAQGDLFFTYSTDAALYQPNAFVYELPKGSNTVTNLGTIGFNEGNTGGPSGPVLDSQGNVFGTIGGDYGNGPDHGRIFELVKGAQSATTLATFHGYDGNFPAAPILDAQGNLFGVTGNGGIGFNTNGGNGTVFELPAGSNTVTTLFAFNAANGWGPEALVADRRGDLFGLTGGGGRFDAGTAFELVKVNSRRRCAFDLAVCTLPAPTATAVCFSPGGRGWGVEKSALIGWDRRPACP